MITARDAAILLELRKKGYPIFSKNLIFKITPRGMVKLSMHNFRRFWFTQYTQRLNSRVWREKIETIMSAYPYCRFITFTTGERVSIEGLVEHFTKMVRRFSKFVNYMKKKEDVRILCSKVEMTYNGTYHLHFHTLVDVPKGQLSETLKVMHRKWGFVLKDEGKMRNSKYLRKYITKIGDFPLEHLEELMKLSKHSFFKIFCRDIFPRLERTVTKKGRVEEVKRFVYDERQEVDEEEEIEMEVEEEEVAGGGGLSGPMILRREEDGTLLVTGGLRGSEMSLVEELERSVRGNTEFHLWVTPHTNVHLIKEIVSVVGEIMRGDVEEDEVEQLWRTYESLKSWLGMSVIMKGERVRARDWLWNVEEEAQELVVGAKPAAQAAYCSPPEQFTPVVERR